MLLNACRVQGCGCGALQTLFGFLYQRGANASALQLAPILPHASGCVAEGSWARRRVVRDAEASSSRLRRFFALRLPKAAETRSSARSDIARRLEDQESSRRIAARRRGMRGLGAGRGWQARSAGTGVVALVKITWRRRRGPATKALARLHGLSAPRGSEAPGLHRCPAPPARAADRCSLVVRRRGRRRNDKY